MNSRLAVLCWIWILPLLVNQATFGQRVGAPRSLTTVVTGPSAPTVTILAAATGAMIRSHGVSNASLDLGRVSYFKESLAPGLSSHKRSKSLVISTRFAIKVDCPGSSLSSKVDVTMSRLDVDASYSIDIDGTTLGLAAQPLAQSMPCGSAAEHRLEFEVPISTPAGPIGSIVAFVAALRK
jgi:hypothetical protein